MATLTKRWTYEDYLKLEDDKRYEIIRGELIEMPAPSVIHQEIVKRLLVFLYRFFELEDKGKVFSSPIDVVLSEDTVVQPDIVMVLKENTGIVKEKGLFGSPDIVVEVISPSTLKRDIEDKRTIYANHGIKEYWLVFPEQKAIEILRLVDNGYEPCSFAYDNGKVESCLVKGLYLSLKDVFGGLK